MSVRLTFGASVQAIGVLCASYFSSLQCFVVGVTSLTPRVLVFDDTPEWCKLWSFDQNEFLSGLVLIIRRISLSGRIFCKSGLVTSCLAIVQLTCPQMSIITSCTRFVCFHSFFLSIFIFIFKTVRRPLYNCWALCQRGGGRCCRSKTWSRIWACRTLHLIQNLGLPYPVPAIVRVYRIRIIGKMYSNTLVN